MSMSSSLFISRILLFPHGFLPLFGAKASRLLAFCDRGFQPTSSSRIAISKVPQRSQLQGDKSRKKSRHQNGWDSKVWSQLNHCVWPLRFEMHIGPSATPTSRVTKMRSPFGAENKRSSFLNGWKSLNIYKDRLHTTKKVESFCGARLAKTTQEVNLVNNS